MLEKYGFNRSSSRDDVNYTDYYWFKNGFSKEELTIRHNTKKQSAISGKPKVQ